MHGIDIAFVLALISLARRAATPAAAAATEEVPLRKGHSFLDPREVMVIRCS
jgi:hypothetical protein